MSIKWRSLSVANAAMLAVAFVLVTSLALFSWSAPLLANVERLAYDIRVSWMAQKDDQDSRIVLVEYDEAAIAKTRRRSPLDRKLLAKALDRLEALGARAVGIDLLFDQPTNPIEDETLRAQIRRSKIPIRFAAAPPGETGLAEWQQEELREFTLAVRTQYAAPANTTFLADSDLIVRRTPPDYRQTLAGELARVAGAPAAVPNQAIEFRRARDPDAARFAVLPILPLATRKMQPEVLEAFRPSVEGRIVLIGADLENIDRHRTPLSASNGRDMAGLEIHAHILAQLLSRAPGEGPGWQIKTAWVVLPALFGMLTGLMRRWAVLRVLIAIASVGVIIVLPFLFELPAGIQTYGLPAAGAVVAWLAMFVATSAVTQAMTNADRRIAREIAHRYLPPDVARAIERRPELLKVHGDRCQLAILCTDLAGFTSLTEKLAPELLTRTLNGYLDVITQVIERHGGTLDKFVGDAVIAFWGAPLADPAAATKAIVAALEIQRFTEEFSEQVRTQGVEFGGTRIGVHFGEVVVGNFGNQTRVQYTALGDAMNLAARLEGANSHLGTLGIVSEELVASAGWEHARDMGAITVKGRHGPCRVFELDYRIDSEIAQHHNTLVNRLRAGEPQAEDEWRALLNERPQDAALQALGKRISAVGWEGVFALENK